MKSLSQKLHFLFSAQLKKTTQLKNLIHGTQLNFIMEAHNGLSAAIVEEAGFKGKNFLKNLKINLKI